MKYIGEVMAKWLETLLQKKGAIMTDKEIRQLDNGDHIPDAGKMEEEVTE